MENQYRRVVPWEGNRAALKAMAEVFTLRSYFEWRGMGFISQSALRAATTRTPNGMPSGASTSPASASPIRKRRNAAKC